VHRTLQNVDKFYIIILHFISCQYFFYYSIYSINSRTNLILHLIGCAGSPKRSSVNRNLNSMQESVSLSKQILQTIYWKVHPIYISLPGEKIAGSGTENVIFIDILHFNCVLWKDVEQSPRTHIPEHLYQCKDLCDYGKACQICLYFIYEIQCVPRI
jgi:hypothetical protein